MYVRVQDGLGYEETLWEVEEVSTRARIRSCKRWRFGCERSFCQGLRVMDGGGFWKRLEEL